MLHLEQLLLKNNLIDSKCVSCKVTSPKAHDNWFSFEFFFLANSHAHKLINYVIDTVLSKHSVSKSVIAANLRYRYTNYVEIVPLNPFDLVLLPKSLVKESGGVGPLCLVYKISKYIHIVDAFNSWKAIRTYEIDARQYWNSPF